MILICLFIFRAWLDMGSSSFHGLVWFRVWLCSGNDLGLSVMSYSFWFELGSVQDSVAFRVLISLGFGSVQGETLVNFCRSYSFSPKKNVTEAVLMSNHDV